MMQRRRQRVAVAEAVVGSAADLGVVVHRDLVVVIPVRVGLAGGLGAQFAPEITVAFLAGSEEAHGPLLVDEIAELGIESVMVDVGVERPFGEYVGVAQAVVQLAEI